MERNILQPIACRRAFALIFIRSLTWCLLADASLNGHSVRALVSLLADLSDSRSASPKDSTVVQLHKCGLI